MFTVKQAVSMAAETMRADGRATGQSDKAVKEDEQAAQAAANAMSRLLTPLLKPIVQVADQLHKVHGAFQQQLFQVLRKAETVADCESYFTWIEGKICEHFAVRDAGGIKAWQELSKEDRAGRRRNYTIATIDGLSSWNTVRSRLTRGYDIQIKTGSTKTTVGALDPRDAKYSGDDGARVWLKEINDIQVKAIEEYNAKLKAETDAKIAEANKGKEGSTDETNGQDDRRLRGAGGMEFTIPEVIHVRHNQLVRVLGEAVKVTTPDKDFYNLIAGEIGRCVENIALLITAEANRVRKLASEAGKSKMTKEQATQELARRRLVLAQNDPIDSEVLEANDDAAAAALAEVNALDNLDAEIMEDDDLGTGTEA